MLAECVPSAVGADDDVLVHGAVSRWQISRAYHWTPSTPFSLPLRESREDLRREVVEFLRHIAVRLIDRSQGVEASRPLRPVPPFSLLYRRGGAGFAPWSLTIRPKRRTLPRLPVTRFCRRPADLDTCR